MEKTLQYYTLINIKSTTIWNELGDMLEWGGLVDHNG